MRSWSAASATYLLDASVLPAHLLERDLDLLVERQGPLGDEAAQAERVPFVDREGEFLGQQPCAQQGRSGEGDVCRSTRRDVVERGWQGSHRVEYRGPMSTSSHNLPPIRPPILPGEPLPTGFRWPDGVKAAAMFTFDVDAEAVMLTDHPEAADYLDVMAHQRYGPMVAVPRLLRMLERVDLRTTFFIPGWVAETWPTSPDPSATPVTRSVTTAISTRASAARTRRPRRATSCGGWRRSTRSWAFDRWGIDRPSCDMNYRTPALVAKTGLPTSQG